MPVYVDYVLIPAKAFQAARQSHGNLDFKIVALVSDQADSEASNRANIWDDAAAQYNNVVGRMSRSAAERLITRADKLDSLNDPNNSAIDLGAGIGSFTHMLSLRFPTLPILATDISERRLDQLRASTRILCKDTVTTCVLHMADPTAQGVPEESFSHVFSTFAMQAVEGQPQSVIQGMRPILRLDGTIALGIWDFDEICGPHEIWRDASQTVDPTYVNPPKFPETQWIGLRQLEAGLKLAGFRDIGTEDFRCQFDVGTEGFMDFGWRSGPDAERAVIVIQRGYWKREGLYHLPCSSEESGAARTYDQPPCSVGLLNRMSKIRSDNV